jgi:glycosyltransferase involved in cell wall biosynthesis
MFEVFSRINQNHEVKIFCGYYSPVNYATEKNLEIEGAITRIGTNGLIPGYGPEFLTCVAESIRRISKFKPDAVVVNNGYEHVGLLSRRCDGVVIPYVHGTDWYRSVNLLNKETLWQMPHFNKLVSLASSSTAAVKIYNQFENIGLMRTRTLLALRRCKINVCVSDYVSRFLKHIDSKINTKVVHHGVDHTVFKPTFEDEEYLLTITRIYPNKNPMLAVKAVKETKHRLLIDGNMERGVESYEKYCQELLSTKGENVRMTLDPSQETLIHDLQACSLFLSPAKNEGVPLVILEAMACGKFTIGHNTGGQAEYLNGNGITCGDDPDEWRKHINRLMNDRAERIILGKHAHAASMKYTWEKTAKEIQETITECA